MKTKQILGLGTIIVLVAIIGMVAVYNIPVSFAARQRTTPTPMYLATPTIALPSMPQATISSEATETGSINSSSQEIPDCSFAAQAPPVSNTLSLDAFIFSEPRIVVTSETQIGLLEWISEAQSFLLIGHPVADSPKEVVETFNIRTGERKRYVEAQFAGHEPIWSSINRGVVFIEYLQDGRLALKLSFGLEKPMVDLALGIPRATFAVDPNHKQMVMLPNVTAQQAQMSILSLEGIEKSPSHLEYLNLGLTGKYGLSLSPDGTRAAIYGKTGFYLWDRTRNNLCQLDLGSVGQEKRWGGKVEWDSTGKFIVLITAYNGQDGVVQDTELTLIDLTTGQQHILDFGQEVFYAYWIPQTYNLIILAYDAAAPSSGLKDIYLLNPLTMEYKNISPDDSFFADRLVFEWTVNKKAIFVPCGQAVDLGADYDEWRICEITAEVKQ